MPSSLSGSIARVLGADNSIQGAGFLVSRRFLVTCTHVIQSALGLHQEPLSMPSGQINIDFPLLPGSEIYCAKLIGWHPDWSQYGGDIAILEIDILSLPVDLVPAPLVIAENISGFSFDCLGFPRGKDYERGIWAQGKIKGRLSEGWIQIQSSIANQGYSITPETIQPGYSGSPVWVGELDGVIGMVVGAESGRGAGFIIPIDVILGKIGLADIPNLCVRTDETQEDKYLQNFIRNTETRLTGPYIPLSAIVDNTRRNGQTKQAIIPLAKVEEAQSLFDRFILVGPAGSGKSTSLKHMSLISARQRVNSKQNTYFPLVVSLSDWQDGVPLDAFLRSRWPFSVDPTLLWRHYRVQLFLDGFDEMGKDNAQKIEQLKSWLSSPLSPSRIILAGRSNNLLLDNFSIPVVSLEPLNNDQINLFISCYLDAQTDVFWRILSSLRTLKGEKDINTLSNLIKTPFFLNSIIFIFKETGYIPENVGTLLEQLSSLYWTKERIRNSLSESAVSNIQYKLGLLSLATYRENMSKGMSSNRVLEFLSLHELDIALNAGILETEDDVYKFRHPLLGAFYAAIQIKAPEIVQLVQDNLESIIQYLNIAKALKTILPGKWHEVIVIFSCICKNDNAIVEIVSNDILLGAECIVSGAKLSTNVYDFLIKEITAWLILKLEDDEFFIGTKGAYLLANIMGVDAIPYLAPLLCSSNENLAIAAAQALGTLGAPSIPVFIDLLGENDERYRQNSSQKNSYAILLGFQELGKTSVPALLSALRDREKHHNACYYLKQLEPDVLLDGLLSALRDPDEEIRSKAGISLQVFCGREALPGLIKLLRDPLVDVRNQAAEVLALHFQPLPVDLLFAELRHPERRLLFSLFRINTYVLIGKIIRAINHRDQEKTETEDFCNVLEIGFEAGRLCKELVDKFRDASDASGIFDEYTRMMQSSEKRERILAVAGATVLDSIGPWKRKVDTDLKAQNIFLLALDEDDSSMNDWGIIGLQKYCDISILPQLLSLLERKPDRAASLRNIYALLGKPALPGLIKMLHHHSKRDRMAALTVMEKLPDPMLVDYLIPFLSRSDEGTYASKALEAIGEPAIPALLKALQNDKKFPTASNALRSIHSPQVITGLRELYWHTNVDIKIKIIITLGGINTDDACHLLMEIASHEYPKSLFSKPEIWCNGFALEALGKMRAITALPLIIQKTQDKNLREHAIKALPYFSSPEAIPALISGLAEKEQEIRNAARWGLIQIGRPAVPALGKSLSNTNVLIRYGAVICLMEIKDHSTIDSLIPLLSDEEKVPGENVRICDYVAEALIQFGTPISIAAVQGWRAVRT